jgi:hypothetical protein
LVQRWTNRTKSRHSDLKDSRDTTKDVTKNQKLTPKQRYARSKKNHEAQKRWRKNNPERAWAIAAVYSAKVRAKKRNIPFDITAAYVVSIMPDKCPVFGTKFKFKGNKFIRPESPCIDRKIPKKGYTTGNIAIISNRANLIKGANSANAVYMVYKWMKKVGLK